MENFHQVIYILEVFPSKLLAKQKRSYFEKILISIFPIFYKGAPQERTLVFTLSVAISI